MKRLLYGLLKPVWLKYTLSYWLPLHLHRIYTHPLAYTRTLTIGFQVSYHKTCWLLVFKNNFACWLLFNLDPSRYSAHFFSQISNWVRASQLSLLSLNDLKRFLNESITRKSFIAWEIQYWSLLLVDWIRSPWNPNLDFEFLGF